MTGENRRRELIKILKGAGQAVTGAQLSETLEVTRQVVVADIALLRASGETIIATPQGYIYASLMGQRARRVVVSRHHSCTDQIRDELYCIVDNGGTIIDVVIDHPLYGEISGNLHLSTRKDVDSFVVKLIETGAEPLSVLTGGMHLHTIEASDSDSLEQIVTELRKKGFVG